MVTQSLRRFFMGHPVYSYIAA